MEWVKLGEIADIKSGGTPSRSKKEYWDNANIPWTKISDFNGKYLNKTEEFINKQGLDNSSAKLFKAGTILYSIFATIGEATILNIDSTTNQAIAGIMVNEDKALKEYVYYFLLSIKKNVISQSRGVAQNNINLSIIKNFNILLPDKKTQKSIIENLSLVETLIQTRKDQIQALDDLVESVFQNTLSNNNICKIKNVAYINPAKSEVKNLDPDTVVSFVPMEDVSENGELNLSKTKTIGDAYKGFTYFRDNDVVVAKITPCFENGKGTLMKNLVNGIGFGTTEFHVLRTKDENILNPVWLNYLTRTKYFRNLGEIRMSGSAGQKRIGKDFVENFKFSLPPLDQQNKFASLVEKIEDQKEILNNSLRELTDLFDCLIQDAFDGSLIK